MLHMGPMPIKRLFLYKHNLCCSPAACLVPTQKLLLPITLLLTCGGPQSLACNQINTREQREEREKRERESKRERETLECQYRFCNQTERRPLFSLSLAFLSSTIEIRRNRNENLSIVRSQREREKSGHFENLRFA